MFSNHVYKIIILPTLLIRIPYLEIFLFCQHNSTAGGNLELRQTIVILEFFGLGTFQLSKKTVKVIGVGVRHRLLFSFFFQNFQVFTRNECRLLSPTSKRLN
jgi:hypothetical protein